MPNTMPTTTPTRPQIVPHLWFDDQAEEAAATYARLFRDATTDGAVARYQEAGHEHHGRPPGSAMTVPFEVHGVRMVGLNGGPAFRFTPAISFFVTVDAADEVDRLWHGLEDGGTPRVPLGAYPFADRFGWIEDRFGVNWQLSTGDADAMGCRVVPTLMYVGDAPRAEAAVRRYAEIFPDAGVDHVTPQPDPADGVMLARFRLAGQTFQAMDGSSQMHDFGFTEATSLMVECEDQDEIDHYWDALTEGGDPAAQRCGWLKDAYGVSWQVVPRELGAMIASPDRERAARVTEAFMDMTKLHLPTLREAFEG